MKGVKTKILDHKIITGICCATFGVIVVTAIVIGFNAQKYRATDKALEYAEKGYITEEELKDISKNGDLVFDEEIVTKDGEVIIFSMDDNGNIVSTTKNKTTDNLSVLNEEEHSQEPKHVHNHTWINHYAERQVQAGSRYVVDSTAIYKSVTCCNECGAKDVRYGEHGCKNGCWSSHTERILVQNEQGHYEPVYTTEKYIDFCYCQECGAHQ